MNGSRAQKPLMLVLGLGFAVAVVLGAGVAKGQTFGSAADAPSLEQEPDLILVVATNGAEGYVLRADLNTANGQAAAESFTSPEEALVWQETEGREDRLIPVYERDGTTLIGSFLVAGIESQRAAAETVE